MTKPYYEEKGIQIYCEDCPIELKKLKDNSIDACVTDPPYGLTNETSGFHRGKANQFTRTAKGGFMGKKWDGIGIEYNLDMWHEILRILKPGGHLLSFGGSRTYHRMACAIEDAGFEIRDQIMWVYGSGFPKSLNIGKAIDKIQGNERENLGISKNGAGNKQDYLPSERTKSEAGVFGGDKKEFELTKGNSKWEGWGTALKPAHEPIVLARKPLSEKTITLNVLKWGVGGLAIDNCRVTHNEPVKTTNREQRKAGWNPDNCGFDSTQNTQASASPQGRFPANLIHDGSQEVLDLLPDTKSTGGINEGKLGKRIYGKFANKIIGANAGGLGDFGSAARFFYCAKASKKERDMGCEGLEKKAIDIQQPHNSKNLEERYSMKSRNNHPTVKPIALMKYLITLISREGQIILDPFMGSGTTGIVCKLLKRDFIGIEMNEEYIKIAQKRIAGVYAKSS